MSLFKHHLLVDANVTLKKQNLGKIDHQTVWYTKVARTTINFSSCVQRDPVPNYTFVCYCFPQNLHLSEYGTSSALGTCEDCVVRSPVSRIVPASCAVGNRSCVRIEAADFRHKWVVVVGEELVKPGFQCLSAHMDLLILNKGFPMLCPCPSPPTKPQGCLVQATRPLLLLCLSSSLGLWPRAFTSTARPAARRASKTWMQWQIHALRESVSVLATRWLYFHQGRFQWTSGTMMLTWGWSCTGAGFLERWVCPVPASVQEAWG